MNSPNSRVRKVLVRLARCTSAVSRLRYEVNFRRCTQYIAYEPDTGEHVAPCWTPGDPYDAPVCEGCRSRRRQWFLYLTALRNRANARRAVLRLGGKLAQEAPADASE